MLEALACRFWRRRLQRISPSLGPAIAELINYGIATTQSIPQARAPRVRSAENAQPESFDPGCAGELSIIGYLPPLNVTAAAAVWDAAAVWEPVSGSECAWALTSL
jgi:hypothetical protein